jgi:hypothetical protein
MKVTRRRLLAICILIFAMGVAAFVGLRRPRPHTVVMQVDIAKAIELANKARTIDEHIHGPLSALAIGANVDALLTAAVTSERYSDLPMAKNAPDDDSDHTRAVDAVAAMCDWSVRTDPPAIRVAVTARDRATAEALADLITKVVRENAVDIATSNLATRRGLEQQLTQTLENRADDQQKTLDRLRAFAAAAPAHSQTSGKILDEAVEGLGMCEVISREITGLQSQIQTQHLILREFEDLSQQCNASATTWTVPAQAIADTGWTRVPRLAPTDAIFSLANPAAGKDWLARALSTSNRALAMTIDQPEVRSTGWMRAIGKGGAPVDAGDHRTLDAAKAELARRIVLTPIGDGSVLAVGLSGDFSKEDRRVLMYALCRGVTGELAEQNSINMVDQRERLDRRLSELGGEVNAVTIDFQRDAASKGISTDRIPDFFETSDLGRRLAQLISTQQTLEAHRRALHLEADSLMREIRLVRTIN